MPSISTTLAPASKGAKDFVSEALGRQDVSDHDVEAYCKRHGLEWREIPTKIAIMDRLIHQAWELVHRLASDGVKFAGSPREAALIVAGTAYAAWRSSLDPRAREHDAAHPVATVSGVSDGIEFAMWHTSGIPAMYADDYIAAVDGSDDPIDRMTPMDALASVWPKIYGAGKVRLAAPRFVQEEGGWGDELWEARPNVLTASQETIRMAGVEARSERRNGAAATDGAVCVAAN